MKQKRTTQKRTKQKRTKQKRTKKGGMKGEENLLRYLANKARTAALRVNAAFGDKESIYSYGLLELYKDAFKDYLNDANRDELKQLEAELKGLFDVKDSLEEKIGNLKYRDKGTFGEFLSQPNYTKRQKELQAKLDFFPSLSDFYQQKKQTGGNKIFTNKTILTEMLSVIRTLFDVNVLRHEQPPFVVFRENNNRQGVLLTEEAIQERAIFSDNVPPDLKHVLQNVNTLNKIKDVLLDDFDFLSVRKLEMQGAFGICYFINSESKGLIFIKSVTKSDNEPAILEVISQKPALKTITTSTLGIVDYKDRVYLFFAAFSSDDGWVNLYSFLRDTNFNESNYTQPEINLLMQNLVDGLNLLHENGIIHHDIKPENLFVNPTNRMQVSFIDFGLSCYDLEGRCATTVNREINRYSTNESGTPDYLYHNSPVYFTYNFNDKIGLDLWSMKILIQELLMFLLSGSDIGKYIMKTYPDRWQNNFKIKPVENSSDKVVTRTLNINGIMLMNGVIQQKIKDTHYILPTGINVLARTLIEIRNQPS